MWWAHSSRQAAATSMNLIRCVMHLLKIEYATMSSLNPAAALCRALNSPPSHFRSGHPPPHPSPPSMPTATP